MNDKTMKIADFSYNIKKNQIIFLNTNFWLVHTDYNEIVDGRCNL
jgi:hypothetical protein